MLLVWKNNQRRITTTIRRSVIHLVFHNTIDTSLVELNLCKTVLRPLSSILKNQKDTRATKDKDKRTKQKI